MGAMFFLPSLGDGHELGVGVREEVLETDVRVGYLGCSKVLPQTRPSRNLLFFSERTHGCEALRGG